MILDKLWKAITSKGVEFTAALVILAGILVGLSVGIFAYGILPGIVAEIVILILVVGGFIIRGVSQ